MKRASKHKYTEREYHVQDGKYVQHKPVKMSYASARFQAFPFNGLHAKTYGVRGLSKNIVFDLNLN